MRFLNIQCFLGAWGLWQTVYTQMDPRLEYIMMMSEFTILDQ